MVMRAVQEHGTMYERIPAFDAAPVAEPAPREPLPPEVPVQRFPEGVLQCEISTPFSMGSTNCWLVVGDDDVLCIDPGTDATLAAQRIGAALAPFGRSVESIRTILVTHTHPDHCGAAAGLADVVDAKVAVGAPEADFLAGLTFSPQRVGATWRALGAPPEEVARAVQRRPPHPAVPSWRIESLADGSQLRAGGRTWGVHLVAGHSPGHVVLAADGMLVAGDHLLANVLPAIHFGPRDSEPEEGASKEPPWADSVEDLLLSMTRFEKGFDATTVLPGHGPAFRGTARPVERARRYHRVRCELVAAKLAARGPTTVWDLALEMYAGLGSPEGVDRRFASAAAEVAGRLEALRRAGRATRTPADETFVFAPA
jgi:glyoxylase-like metal-dependent hydrolase (beta-lactamase superfamily II)